MNLISYKKINKYVLKNIIIEGLMEKKEEKTVTEQIGISYYDGGV